MPGTTRIPPWALVVAFVGIPALAASLFWAISLVAEDWPSPLEGAAVGLAYAAYLALSDHRKTRKAARVDE